MGSLDNYFCEVHFHQLENILNAELWEYPEYGHGMINCIICSNKATHHLADVRATDKVISLLVNDLLERAE